MKPFDVPILRSIETRWHRPWLIASCAQVGERQLSMGQSIQDSHATGAIGDCCWLICADGVGSTKQPRLGSQHAVISVEATFIQALSAGEPPSISLVLRAFQEAHASLCNLAASKQLLPQDLASTLIAVLLTPDVAHAAAIGDSACLAFIRNKTGEEEETHLYPIVSGTFDTHYQGLKPSTSSISQPNWRQMTEANTCEDSNLETILLATDGFRHFHQSLSKTGKIPKPGYIEALPTAAANLTPRDVGHFFESYLNQRKEEQDDRTLVLAFRYPEDRAPPLPAAQSR